MTEATVTVEILPDDGPGERMMRCLRETITEHCADLTCTLTKKPQFDVARTFDEGIDAAMQSAVALSESVVHSAGYSIYMSPRRLDFYVENRTTGISIGAVVLAFARERRPLAVFLQTITEQQVPHEVRATLESVMEDARNRLIPAAIDPGEHVIVEKFIGAVAIAYRKAFTKSSLN